MIQAYIDDISLNCANQHSIDRQRVMAIVDAIRYGHTLPLPLVVADNGNGSLVLDGHHRLAAYRYLRDNGEYGLTTDAYVITSSDFDELIADVFAGDMPANLSDIDDYIQLPDGSTYER